MVVLSIWRGAPAESGGGFGEATETIEYLKARNEEWMNKLKKILNHQIAICVQETQLAIGYLFIYYLPLFSNFGDKRENERYVTVPKSKRRLGENCADDAYL